MIFLTRIEEILLLSIWKLREDAYGISIRRQVEKETGVRWMSGAVYAPLGRLKKNGYIAAYRADGATRKGGRPRIYYRLTPLGLDKLAAIQEINRSLWQAVPDLKKETMG